MDVEAIGIVAMAVGVIGWIAGMRFALPVFFAATLLSAAAALVLPALGGANIQPAHLLLGFLALGAVTSRQTLRRIFGAMAIGQAGFWLLLTAAYVVLSGYFLPRIFAGATYVYAIARTDFGTGIVLQPLGPVSGNITQSVYFIGDLICFLVFFAYSSRPEGLKAAVNGALVCTAINLVFAAIDLGSYWGGLGDVLGFLRNADYRMLDRAVVLGFKRVVGSFPEASTYAYFTSGLFAFCARLWVAGIRRRLTAPLALLSLVTLLLSTSSTGYAATVGFLALLLARNVTQLLTGPANRRTLAIVVLVPLIVGSGLIAMRLDPPLWRVVSQMTDETVFDKLQSSSGLEREKWSAQALVNFTDTHGFGAGNGSVRASSFPVAVLGNIGVFGAVTYGAFLLDLLCVRRRRWTEPFPASCQSAARWACATQLIGASVAGGFIDLGLSFFIFAGLACAGPVPEEAASPAAIPALAD